MGQVTIYLDPGTEAKMRAAAKSMGMSQSKWVAKLIQEKTANSWQEGVKKIYHYTSIESLALILKTQKIRFTRLDRVDDVREAQEHCGINFVNIFS